MTQPSVTLGYHTFVGEYKLGDEITTFSIPALKEHDNGVRDKALDEVWQRWSEHKYTESLWDILKKLRQEGKDDKGNISRIEFIQGVNHP